MGNTMGRTYSGMCMTVYNLNFNLLNKHLAPFSCPAVAGRSIPAAA